MRGIEHSYLQLEAPDESAMNDLLGHSITYRIAVGPQAGRKAFTLQTVPAREQDHDNPNLAKTAGFSLHAGVAAKAHQRRKLERLCRYVARPAVATDRLALTPRGNVRYTLKTPYRDGTTHILLEPLDFIARLAALVPKPRVNLTRFARIVLILARCAGPLKRSKYVPDAFFTGSSPPTADRGNR